MRIRLLSLLVISVGLLLRLGEAYANGAAPQASPPSFLEQLSGGTALALGGLGVLVVGIVVLLFRIARWAGRG